MRRSRVVTAFLAAMALVAMGSQTALAAPLPVSVVYDSIPASLPGNVASLGFQATQTNEVGDLVRLAPGPRVANDFTVVMSSWACETGEGATCVTTPGATFPHPITLTLYAVDRSGPLPEPGLPLLTQTHTFDIPFRPSADTENCTTQWYDGTNCYNGFANTIAFDLSSSNTVLPSEVIWGISYNTQSYGTSPTTTEGPWNSLNVGIETFPGQPSVGTDVDPDGLIWNTETAAWYCDGGTGGVGTFRNDTSPGCWTANKPLAQLTTVPAALSESTVVVDPTSLDGWTFAEAGTTASHAFVSGPSTPPAGIGSLSETVGANGDDYTGAWNADYDGVALDSITKLEYSTYVAANQNCQATYMSLSIDTDGIAGSDNRLYFEPCYQNGGYGMTFPGSTIPDQGDVLYDTWQDWDADVGGWWDANGELSAGGPPLFTLADYLNAHPDATIVSSSSGGGVRLFAGGGAGAWDDFQGNADKVIIGVDAGLSNITETTYDFEPFIDASAPVVSAVATTPDPASAPATVTLTANVDDSTTGGSTIASAEYRVGLGAWTPMTATDLAFDQVSEDVQATISGLAVGTYDVCVRGTDSVGNTSAGTTCTTAHVLAQPSITIGNVGPKVEGNSGNVVVNIPVTLSGPGALPINVHWATGGGTATPGQDYVYASGNLHWNAGDGSAKVIHVSIKGDLIDEPNQTFNVTLSAATNATIADGSTTVTIADNDAGPAISIRDASRTEGNYGNSSMNFQVTLNRRSEFAVTVRFTTVDGTAKAGFDYVSISGTLTFPPGTTSLSVTVPVRGDRQREANERFTVKLFSQTNSSIQRSTGTGTIINDD
jgi:Calx-beta domain-containing protein